MCRNIKTLFNFDPPVTDDEVRAASLQFVRKITGFNKPSKANEDLFLAAVDEVAGISMRLLRSLETNAPPKNREEEAAKAKARAAERFGALNRVNAADPRKRSDSGKMLDPRKRSTLLNTVCARIRDLLVFRKLLELLLRIVDSLRSAWTSFSRRMRASFSPVWLASDGEGSSPRRSLARLQKANACSGLPWFLVDGARL